MAIIDTGVTTGHTSFVHTGGHVGSFTTPYKPSLITGSIADKGTGSVTFDTPTFTGPVAMSSLNIANTSTTGTLLTGSSAPNLLTTQQADFESAGSAGWTFAPTNCVAPNTSATVALHGSRCMEMISIGVHTVAAANTPQAATAGSYYTAMASFRSSGSNVRSFYLTLKFLDVNNTTLSATNGTTVVSNGTNWRQSVVSMTAPAGTTQTYIVVRADVLNVGGAGESYYVDCT